MKLLGFAVHLLTGLGAVCALLAVEALIAGAWPRMFLWLGVAFLIDGIDGPIARAIDVKQQLPRFSGARIDLVVDYLTYVFVPALALLLAGRVPEPIAHLIAALILLTSLFHFSDVESKSDDLSFVGFPAIWNIVTFYVFALDLGSIAATLIVLAAAALTFVPLHWVHPMRVTTLRPLTVALTVLWSAAALWALHDGFPASLAVQAILVGVALYGFAISLWLSRRLWH